MHRLVLDHVTKDYATPSGPLRVLDDVSFALAPGDTLAVTGPSGTGKSSLLNLIGSLDRPTAGTIRLGNTDVGALEGAALAAYRAGSVGFVFQEHNLLPQLTALENVLLPLLARGNRVADAAPARALLDRVGVGDRANHFPAHLSGGERQRVAIARALVTGARLLLCDEPTGNLDLDTSRTVLALFLELARQETLSIIMVTHNLELAAALGQRAELRRGHLATT
jgi:lipoprotein-releasing system ATP-binding protein